MDNINHFLDIGANVGQTFDDFLTKTTEYDGWCIWLFEPSPRHVPALMEKAREMSNRYNVIVCPFGIRKQNNVEMFFQKDDPRGDSFHSYLASDHVTVNTKDGYHLICSSVGINDMLENIHGKRIIVKMDAEGSEFEILTALATYTNIKKVEKIYVEWHFANVNATDMTQADIFETYKDKVPIEQWMF